MYILLLLMSNIKLLLRKLHWELSLWYDIDVYMITTHCTYLDCYAHHLSEWTREKTSENYQMLHICTCIISTTFWKYNKVQMKSYCNDEYEVLLLYLHCKMLYDNVAYYEYTVISLVLLICLQ